MKWSTYIYLILSLFVCGCIKTTVNEAIEENHNSIGYKGAAILSISSDGDDFSECIKKRLDRKFKSKKFYDGQEVRDHFFPWFERTSINNSMENLPKIFATESVRQRIVTLSIDLFIFVKGHTAVWGKYGGSSSHGVISGWEKHTYIDTKIWAIQNNEYVGETSIYSEGTAHLGWIIIPLWYFPAPTESATCNETAEHIAELLKKYDSLNK